MSLISAAVDKAEVVDTPLAMAHQATSSEFITLGGGSQ